MKVFKQRRSLKEMLKAPFKRFLKRRGELTCTITFSPAADGAFTYTVRQHKDIPVAHMIQAVDAMRWDLNKKLARKAYASGYRKGIATEALVKKLTVGDLV